MKTTLTSILMLLVVGFLWGLNWTAVKFMMSELPPYTIRAIAFPAAAALLAIYSSPCVARQSTRPGGSTMHWVLYLCSATNKASNQEPNLNGIHDMGGMHGFGQLDIEQDEPVFHTSWEGRTFAMCMYTPVECPGGFRYTIENINPALYLSYTYYEKWLHARITGMLVKGVFSQEEFDARTAWFQQHPDQSPPVTIDQEKRAQAVSAVFEPMARNWQKGKPASFKVGQRVRAKNRHPAGHTRLPGYCRDKCGVIEKAYEEWPVDDTPAAGMNRAIEWLYRVRFDAQELWGDTAEPNQALYIDMFESYLSAENS